ncbi:MAG: sensor domain-containing protein [Clostridium sp.]
MKTKNQKNLLVETLGTNYEILLNTIPHAAWITDINHRYIYVNKALCYLTKTSKQEILNNTHKNIFGETPGDICMKSDKIVLETKKTKAFIEELTLDGVKKKYKIVKTPILNNENASIAIVSVIKDIYTLETKEAQLNYLMENIPFRIWISDTTGNIITTNKALSDSLNLKTNELVGKNLSNIYSDLLSKEIHNENELIRKSRKPLKILKSSYENNQLKHFEIHKSPILDTSSNLIGIIGTIIDITETTNVKKELEKRSYLDFQTGLYNRRALYSRLNENNFSKQLTTIIIDIDNFKFINDIHGHDVGDEVILAVSDVLKELFIPETIFRYGGDEFMIFSPNFNTKVEISTLCTSLVNSIGNHPLNKKLHCPISVSIGISMCQCKYSNESDHKKECSLLKRADIALYKAKNSGKNQFKFYDLNYEEEFNRALNIEVALKNSINNDDIYLCYQPQYTKDKKLVGFEALIRWNNPTLNSISIIDAIAVLEKTKLILPIGEYVMRKSFEYSNRINKISKEKLIVSVNISPVQIMDSNFVSTVENLIKETGVDTSTICFEITETSLLENIDDNLEKINKIKNFGVSLSIDDFGVGYCSLSYFLKLPINELKLDKTFIDEITTSKSHNTIITLIINAAKSLNIKTVAEGVETKEQLLILDKLGVDFIQGYLFSKPLKEEDTLKLI